jgi:septation ring formation regulator EzrA
MGENIGIKKKKQSKMKDKIIIIGIILLIGLFIWDIMMTKKIKTDIKSYKEKIESIQVKIDSAKIENQKFDKKIDSLNAQVTIVNNDINKIENNIKVIKKNTDEKVNSVDNMSDLELKQFFTNRYNQYNTPK